MYEERKQKQKELEPQATAGLRRPHILYTNSIADVPIKSQNI